MRDGLRRRRFGGDRSIVGRILSLSGSNRAVIGVMARSFEFDTHADVWTPLTSVSQPRDRSAVECVVARLKPGVTPQAAQSDMASVAERLRGEYAETLVEGERAFVRP